MKRLYSLSIIISSVALSSWANWDGTSSTAFTIGDGSESNPFIIENEAQFIYFQKSVTDGEAYEGKFFQLNSDLDFSGNIINPIGYHDDYLLEDVSMQESRFFLGSFDGNFHTIDNAEVVLPEVDPDEIGGLGVFAGGRTATVVKNLKIGGSVKVNGEGTVDVGGIMGISYGSTIENCSFAGEIIGGGTETGGIVGFAQDNSKISGCIFSGSISGNSFTGGIVGATDASSVTDCLYRGSINGNQGYWVAGIIAWALNSNISDCLSIGEVKGVTGSSFLPGKSPVCAEFERSTADNCYYVESLTGCKPLSDQTGVSAITEEEMMSQEMVANLNGGETIGRWISGEDGIPTLAWINSGNDAIYQMGANSPIALRLNGNTVSLTSEDAVMTVYDLNGHKLLTTSVSGQYDCQLKSGGIIITLSEKSGSVKTFKVIL